MDYEKKYNEALEQASKEYCPDDAYPFGPDIINKEVRKAFIAGWKAKEESENSVPADLEEAAWDCVLDSVDVNNPVLLPKYKELLTYLFIAGAKWDRSQMLKEAVEGTYNNSDWGTPCIDLPSPLELERFDKVRIIIIKDDGKSD